MCTGHAVLRDRYKLLSSSLDILILATSTWVVALAFVDPVLNSKLTPHWTTPPIWTGLLSVAIFFFSLIQLKTDWKSRAESHARTVDLYAEVKREAGYILASEEFDSSACQRALSRYDMGSAVGAAIPEKDFLRLKKKHRIKVAISKKLDETPSASIVLLRLRMWITDNFRRGRQ
jgi:hypothetical protein